MSGLMSAMEVLFRRIPGFKADEVMTGTHHFENVDVFVHHYAKELPMEFRGTWGSDNLVGFLQNLLTASPAIAELKGVVDIDGLCEAAPMQGTLELRYLVDATIKYEFFFSVGDDEYRYVGQKLNLRPWNLHKTHTTCYGILMKRDPNGCTWEPISKSVTYFRLSTALAFLKSFRLT